MVAVEQLVIVFIAGLVTALATGLGALPFFFFDSISDRRNVLLWGLSSGIMVSASLFGLVGEGLAEGADRAGIELVGGETAVMPEVVKGLDLAGTCAGLAAKDALFPGSAEVGDALVGVRSSGIHSNGLTLARTAVTRDGEYTDPCPFGDYDTLGEALLEPTRIYTDLLDPMRNHGVHAAAHVTGGGWTNLERLGDHRYVVDNAFDPHPVFEFVQEAGNVSDEEMHRTFNMGTGFVAALPSSDAEALADTVGGRVIGHVEEGDGIAIRGLEL